MEKNKKIKKRITAVLCAVLLGCSVYIVFHQEKEHFVEKKYYESLEELSPDSNSQPEEDINIQVPEEENKTNAKKKKKVQPWAKKLTKRNDEAVGWVKIPGFTDSEGKEYINFPVVQHNDNEFYLTHDIDKQYFQSGSIFVDCYDKITAETQPDNIVMYGHHMRNLGTSFTHLAEYKSGVDFLRKYPIIEFNTIYDSDEEYVIFSCYVAAADESQDDDLFDYWRYHYFDDEDYKFDTWLKRTKESSWYSCDIECDEDDDYITLSTCSNEVPNMRWVITAKKIEEDDNKKEIIESYDTKNDKDIYFPPVWTNVWGNHTKYLGWNY